MTIQPSPRMFAATDRAATRMSDAIVLVARILIGWLFLTNGWAKVVNPQGFVKYLASLQVPNPDFWVWPSMAAELSIGVALILGIAVRYVSLFTVVYLIIATALAHRYWEYPAAQQVNQYAHFCKNLAVMGGAALLYLTGGGRFSLDNRLRQSNR
jgi:putative oxidoreductase